MTPEFTIIVPVYNEADNLLRVEEALLEYMDISFKKTGVLFVDDGSTDDSLGLIQEICQRNINFHYLSFDKNYGLSTAIKAGFDYVKSPIVGYIDSDLQTDPEDFNLLLKEIDTYDLVNGVRQGRKDSFIKNKSSKFANSFRRAFTHDGMDDTGCPLKVIKTAYAKEIPMFRGLHRFLPAMVLLQGGKIKQLPVRHYPRMAGKSKFHLTNRLFGPLLDCFAFLWMKKKYITYKVSQKDE